MQAKNFTELSPAPEAAAAALKQRVMVKFQCKATAKLLQQVALKCNPKQIISPL
jgi:hypothetical protein